MALLILCIYSFICFSDGVGVDDDDDDDDARGTQSPARWTVVCNLTAAPLRDQQNRKQI